MKRLHPHRYYCPGCRENFESSDRWKGAGYVGLSKKPRTRHPSALRQARASRKTIDPPVFQIDDIHEPQTAIDAGRARY